MRVSNCISNAKCATCNRGQGQDILWRDTVNCPTEEQYEQMVIDKTGGLFRLAVGLMRVFATTNQDEKYTKLVNDLALYFQIRDDLVNLASEEVRYKRPMEGFEVIGCVWSSLGVIVRVVE